MADITYTVKLDTASAQAQAAQLRAIFQQQLKDIDLSAISKAASTATAQATAEAKAAAQERIQAAKAETVERTQAARAAANAEIEEEKRATAAFKAELQQRTQATQQQTRQPQQPIGGGLGTLGNAVLGGVAGYFTVQGARQIAAQAEAFAEFGTQVRRTEASFKILSGSAGEAEARINAIKAAGGGAVSSLQAMELANQAVSLHLASTAQEFGNLTKAGREIALVSPVIHDVQGAISELGLAASNLSYRRLDQLGLSATEVKAKMAELQAANAGLDDSQAFLAASIDVLNTKYGTLLQTQEAQASGVERLKVAWDDLWASIAKGSTIDNVFGKVADSLDIMTGKFDAVKQQLNEGIPAALQKFQEQSQRGLFPQDNRAQIGFLTDIQARLNSLGQALATNQPGALAYAQALATLAQQTEVTGIVTGEQVQALQKAQAAYRDATVAAKQLADQTRGDNPEERRTAAQAQLAQAQAARQQQLDDLLAPISKLGNDLKGSGLDSFFRQLHDGLAASADITATANNRLNTMRQQLVDIGRAVADSGGQVTEAQRNQVEAINRQIEALNRAASLNEKLKAGDKGAGGQDLDAIYQRLNAIIAQTRGEFDQTANAARALGDAIAQSGNASADQIAQLGQLAAQANQADFSRLAASLRELNSGSLDAIPGIDSLRDKLAGFYETLASGQGLTAAQAAEFAGLNAEADALGSSASALAGIQAELGYRFLDSNAYASELVGQIASLEALYGGGKIGADEFAGGMAGLTTALYNQLNAAGVLTPKLRELLALLGAVNAAAGGQVGPAGPFFGGFPGGGGVNTNSPGYQAGVERARAAAELARSKADAGAREEALKAQKKAASGAQSAFEDAAKGTQKAFEAVVDDMRSALQKVEGLFSPSKVTAEDIAASKAGVYQPKADELLRQVKSAAENPADVARFASQIAQAREALSKIGVAPAENIKALAAQLEQAWSSSALFANKDNLKLINADAVKLQLNLQAKAKEGQQNIYEYFGATLDGVKEKFAAKDPTIVEAVAAELQGSQDKNLKALGKSLEDGINGAVEKTLKNLAAAEAGFSKGGGGGSGGGAVSVGAIPTTSGGGTWIDTVSKNVGNAYQNFANLYAPGPGVTIPKTGNSTLFGPPAPNNPVDTTGLAPTELSGKVKISEITLDPALVNGFNQKLEDALKTATPTPADIGKGVSEAVAIGFRDAKPSVDMAGAFIQMLGGQFGGRDATKGQATLTGLGEGISGAIEKAFTGKKDHEDMAGAFIQMLGNQFGGRDASKGQVTLEGLGESLSGKIETGFVNAKHGTDLADAFNKALSAQFGGFATNYTAIGDTISYLIESGIANRTNRLDMATGFVNALAASFGAYAANYTAIGDTISYSIESAVANRPERLDMAGNFINSLTNQFGSADAIATYISTGSSISYLIESSIANRSDRLDMASGLIKDLTTQLSQQDYSTPVTRFTNGLRSQFGATSDQFNAIGQGVAQFIGLGITDYDLSGVGSTLIGNISGSFTGDAALAQLQGIGSAISGAIFQGFQSSIAYQPWLSTIVQEVVSQALESMATSVNDSLQVQAVGL